MAFTQADLDSIRATIASGVMETRFADGRTTRWQSLDQLLAAEQRIASSVSSALPGVARRRRRTPIYRNGL